MNSGETHQITTFLGIKIQSTQSYKEVEILSDQLGLIGKINKKNCFDMDKEFLIYSQSNYSNVKSLYYDLVGVAKIINSGSLDEESKQEAVSRFKNTWEKLAKIE